MVINCPPQQVKVTEQNEHNLTYVLMISTDKHERNPKTRV